MEEWKECKLGDICKTNINSYSEKDNWSFVNYLDTGNITENKISDIQFIDLSSESLPSRARRKVQLNDIIYSTVRPNQKHFGIIKNQPENFLVSTGFAVLHINKTIADPNFIFYNLIQNENTESLHAIAEQTTSAYPAIKPSDIENLSIKLPPLPTQQKIAAILSSIDDKIELNNKINTNLELQIEALLMNYISREETSSAKLGDYLYIKGRIGWKGLKKNEYLEKSNYRIINGETLTKAGIDWNKAGYISEERYTESPEIMLQIGDILLSKDGTIGKIGYVDELELPTSVASGIFVIRNNQPDVISTTFIYYLLKSKIFDSFIIARTEGSVIPHLYQKDFMDFDFPLPSPELMNEFEKTTSPMFNQIINNLKENKKLTSLRDSLLPKLMNGEIEANKK